MNQNILTCMGEKEIDETMLQDIEQINVLTKDMGSTSQIILTAFLYGYAKAELKAIGCLDKKDFI